AIGLGAFASCALAMQGCGVLVSSDCAQRADCVEEAGRMEVATPPPVLDSSFSKSETGGEVAGDAIGTLPDAHEAAGARDATADREVDSGTDSQTEGDSDAGDDVSVDAD